MRWRVVKTIDESLRCRALLPNSPHGDHQLCVSACSMAMAAGDVPAERAVSASSPRTAGKHKSCANRLYAPCIVIALSLRNRP